MIGAMSCNPAIGGLGKGHLVREVDAFDGHDRARCRRGGDPLPDAQRLQRRGGAGPAYPGGPQAVQGGDSCLQGAQRGWNLDGDRGGGGGAGFSRPGSAWRVLSDGDGRRLRACHCPGTGTFLGGKMFCGEERLTGGRVGEAACDLKLGDQLRARKLPMARLKTGTPPRLDGERSIGRCSMSSRPTTKAGPCRTSPGARVNPQLFCAITRTKPPRMM
jgi:tRNA uridine 5-carboxymethylaminomethyl modification enzyme